MSQLLPKYPTAARFDRSSVDRSSLDHSTVDMDADRPIVERSDLVLACAQVLHTNGQSTHETVQAAEQLGTQLGLRATMIAHWEELELRAADGTGSQVSFQRGSPTGINMERVSSAMSAIENSAVGRAPIDAALENIKAHCARTAGSHQQPRFCRKSAIRRRRPRQLACLKSANNEE
jgi:hypothetical protein